MTTTPEWVAIVAPFASGALGIGIAWGSLRVSINSLKDRINKMEDKLDDQVGVDRCRETRDECKRGIQRELDKMGKKYRD